MEISVKDLYAVAEATKTMAAKMRESADSAEKMAKAVQTIVDDCAAQLKAKKEAPTVASAPDQSVPVQNEPTQKKITLAELRAYVAERSSPQTRPKIKEILTRFGAAKLTELPEEQYAAVMDEVAKL